MPLTCNIGAKGKRVRLVMGIGLEAAGFLTAIFWARWGGGWRWAVPVVLVAAGAFAVFEARAGWCALRAMGVKTRV
jgi:hypothetical protein